MLLQERLTLTSSISFSNACLLREPTNNLCSTAPAISPIGACTKVQDPLCHIMQQKLQTQSSNQHRRLEPTFRVQIVTFATLQTMQATRPMFHAGFNIGVHNKHAEFLSSRRSYKLQCWWQNQQPFLPGRQCRTTTKSFTLSISITNLYWSCALERVTKATLWVKLAKLNSITIEEFFHSRLPPWRSIRMQGHFNNKVW